MLCIFVVGGPILGTSGVNQWDQLLDRTFDVIVDAAYMKNQDNLL